MSPDPRLHLRTYRIRSSATQRTAAFDSKQPDVLLISFTTNLAPVVPRTVFILTRVRIETNLPLVKPT